MIGIANQFLSMIYKAFSQGKVNRTEFYTGIHILKNAVQTLYLFSGIGKYERLWIEGLSIGGRFFEL